MPGAEHIEVFNCSVQDFYAIVSDYEKYPDFLQEVKSCKVLKTDGAKKLVEFKVAVIKSFAYQLWMTEKAPNEISWTFASGDIFKTSEGSWRLSDQNGKTKAHYKVDATFSMFVPGPIAKTLLTVNLPMMISSYHKRIKEIYGK
jgi:ribosome-associated toxin RatA of RatAB toxin-antitoxin module